MAVPTILDFDPKADLAIDPGLSLRQLRTKALPPLPSIAQSLSGGDIIYILINSFPYAFLDTSSTYLHVLGTFRGQVTLNTAYITAPGTGQSDHVRFTPLSATQANNDNLVLRMFAGYAYTYFVGNMWAMFSRYQLMANQKDLIDELYDPGAIEDFVKFLNKSRNASKSHSLLGYCDENLFPGFPIGGNLAFLIHSTQQPVAATYALTNGSFTVAGAQTIVLDDDLTLSQVARKLAYLGASDGGHLVDNYGFNFATYKASADSNFVPFCVPKIQANQSPDRQNDDYLAVVQLGPARPIYVEAAGIANGNTAQVNLNTPIYALGETITWYADVDVMLPMIGLLGPAMDQAFYLGYGNTEIRLTTARVQDYLLPSVLHADPNSNITFEYRDIAIVGDILQCTPTLFGKLVRGLNGVINIRTQSYTRSQYWLPAGSDGNIVVPITSRKGSTKGVMCLFRMPELSRDGSNGRLGSLNPYLTYPTYIRNNNEQYPPEAYDPLRQPVNTLVRMMQTLGLNESNLHSPSFNVNEWAVAPSDVSGTIYRKYHRKGEDTFLHRNNYLDDCVFGGDIKPRPIQSNRFFVYIDTEVVGRKGYISGIDTTSGNFWFVSTIDTSMAGANGLPSGINAEFFCFHDLLVKFNIQQGTISVGS